MLRASGAPIAYWAILSAGVIASGCGRHTAPPAPRTAPLAPDASSGAATPAASPGPLVGAWLAAEPGETSVNGPKIVLVFDDHGGLVETMSVNTESVVLKSTYSVQGNNLTERFVSLTGIDAQVPKSDRVKTFQFKVNGDTLSLTQKPANNVMVFTRVAQPEKIH